MKKLAVFLAFFAIFKGGALALVPSDPTFDYNTPSTVNVTWVAGGSPYWAVFAADETFATFISSESLPASQTNRLYTGLKANTTYHFKYKFEAEDDSQYTTPISSAIAAVPPAQVSFPEVYYSSVSTQWSTLENSPFSEFQPRPP